MDTVGGEKFTLHVLDLATGQELLTPAIEVRSSCQHSPVALARYRYTTHAKCL